MAYSNSPSARKEREKAVPDRFDREASQPARLQDLVRAATIGTVVPAALHMYQLDNTTTKSELANFFTANNFTPNAADNLADKVLEIAGSQLGKAAFLGLAGGALIFSMLETVRPRWPWRHKMAIAIGVGMLLAILYFLLALLNITT